MALTNKLSAIGEAIREKTGKTELLTLDQMPVEIRGIETGPSGENKLAQLVDGSITEIYESDLGDITTISTEAFYQKTMLRTVELPDSITAIGSHAFSGCSKLNYVKIPYNLKRIETNAFNNCHRLSSLTFNTLSVPILSSSDIFPTTSTFKLYVLGEKYDDFISSAFWGTSYKSYLVPTTKYVSPISLSQSVVAIAGEKTLSMTLQNYDTPPEINYVINNPSLVEVNINEITNTNINFTLKGVDAGEAIITFNIPGDNNYEFNRQHIFTVVEELTPPSYSVENVGTTYGFDLDDEGWYVSNNKGKQNSFAYCKININNMSGVPVYLDCISYGENNYDYGLLSAINTDLTQAHSDGTYLHSFKGKASSSIQTIEYLDAVGECYITVKYKKDSSGDSYDDTFKFQVRFG